MIVDRSELGNIREEHEGERVALRLGCFDLRLHGDHRKAINFAASEADYLVVGVMSDAYVTKEKGPGRPIDSELVRAQRVDDVEEVAYSFVAPAGRLALAGVLYSLRPDVYVEGAEYGAGRLKSAFLGALGVEYIIDTRERTMSTSAMLAGMAIQDAVEAPTFNLDPQTLFGTQNSGI